jgi:hypothetical protein
VPGTITESRVRVGKFIDADIEYRYVHFGRILTGYRVRSLAISVNWSRPAGVS